MTRLCDVDGCELEHYGRGWCQLHYNRWHRYGDVKADIPLGNGTPGGRPRPPVTHRTRVRPWRYA